MRWPILIALLALAGCGRDDGGNRGNTAAPANQSADNGAAAASATTTPDSPIVGRWGDNGDCSRPIEFFGNGTFRANDGTRGHWTIAGDQLTMRSGSRSVTFRIESLTHERAVVIDANGQRGESVRCS